MSCSDEILQAYLRLTQHASRQFRLHFGKSDLTFPQALVLSALTEEAPVPISVLAQKTGSANSTVSGIVDRLEKMGLVERVRSEEDRRVIYVDLTARCRQIRENASADVNSYFYTLLKDLPEEEQESILRALLRLGEVLGCTEEGLL
jgi:DNA-binding MarR family transcriptional regulator